MSKRLGLILITLTALIWAVNPLIYKFIFEYVSPRTLIGVINIFMTLTLIIISLVFDRKGLFDAFRGFRLLMLFSGIILAGNFIAFASGLDLTTAVAAQILILTEVVFFAVWGFVFFHEKATWKKVSGIALAVVGVFVVSWNGKDLGSLVSSEYFFGNMIVLLAAFLFSVYMAFQKRLADQQAGFTTLVPIFVIASTITFALAPKNEVVGIDPSILGIICGTGVLIAVAFFLLAKSLEYLSSSTIAVILLTSPVITVIIVGIGKYLGFFSLENLTAYIILGGAALLLGAFLVISEQD